MIAVVCKINDLKKPDTVLTIKNDINNNEIIVVELNGEKCMVDKLELWRAVNKFYHSK